MTSFLLNPHPVLVIGYGLGDYAQKCCIMLGLNSQEETLLCSACDGLIDVLVIIVCDKCLVHYLRYLLLMTVTDTSIVSLISNCC